MQTRGSGRRVEKMYKRGMKRTCFLTYSSVAGVCVVLFVVHGDIVRFLLYKG